MPQPRRGRTCLGLHPCVCPCVSCVACGAAFFRPKQSADTLATAQLGSTILTEASLSFLGLSVQLPQSTWGNMINEARRDIKQNTAQVFWPSLVLSVTVLSLNQVGDFFQRRGAVRDAAL